MLLPGDSGSDVFVPSLAAAAAPQSSDARDVLSVMGLPRLCAAEKKHQSCQGTFPRLSPRQHCIGCRGWRCGTEIVASHVSSPKMAALLPLQCASSLPLAKRVSCDF